jgi:hypothetical protein
VVAEKFHAVCLLGLSNTRMKDYFDLWVLLDDKTLDPLELRSAIEATFARRKMALPSCGSSLPSGPSGSTGTCRGVKQRWHFFSMTLQLTSTDELQTRNRLHIYRRVYCTFVRPQIQTAQQDSIQFSWRLTGPHPTHRVFLLPV